MPNVLSTVLPTLFLKKWEELPQRKSFCSYYTVNAFLYYYIMNISDIRLLDFVIDRFFMKLLKTNHINTVRPKHNSDINYQALL